MENVFPGSLKSKRAVIIAAVMLMVAVFGLRGIIITPALIRILGDDSLRRVMSPIYWIVLALSVALFAVNHLILYQALQRLASILRDHLRSLAYSLLSAAPFLYLTITERLGLDFWLDELLSIKNHIIPSLGSALFWYPLPNNHILNNALSGLFLRLLGWSSLPGILQTPQQLRVLYLVFGLGTIVVMGVLADRFVGGFAGPLSVIVLCSTIPYLNFVVQVRGYSASIFFATSLLLSILVYTGSSSRLAGMSVMALSAMIAYTIPSNLYYLAGIGAFSLLLGGAQLARSQTNGELSPRGEDQLPILNEWLSVVALMMGGVTIAFLLYIPVLPNLLKTHYVRGQGIFQGTALPGGLLAAMRAFISHRAWLFVFAGVGLVISALEASRSSERRRTDILALLVASFLLPFLWSTIRGDSPPVRVFLITLPSVAILAAIGLQTLTSRLMDVPRFGKWLRGLSLLVIGAYSYGAFFMAYQGYADLVHDNLVKENSEYIDNADSRLTASVFLDGYALRSVIQEFQRSDHRDLPVIIDEANTRYPWTVSTYLEAYGITFQSTQDLANTAFPEAYVFLSYPHRSLDHLRMTHPEAVCSPVSKEISIYRIVRCRFSDAD